jgi:NTE family protein
LRVALVLGAGGARGYAHIGAIEVLEERGFGKLPDYTQWVRTIGQRDVLRMLDPTLTAPGAFRGNKVLGRVSGLLDGARIEELPVAFTAVATDLLARREVWFQHGPVDVAIRASVGVPAVVTPVVIDGRLLADGGLTNPLPIAPTLSTPADAIIAVSLSGRRKSSQRGAPPSPVLSETRRAGGGSDRAGAQPTGLLDHRIRWGIAFHLDCGEVTSAQVGRVGGPDGLPPGLGKLDMMTLAVEAMHDAVTRYQLASYPPDILIEVPTDACRSHEFHRAPEMIDLGRRLTAEALDRAASRIYQAHTAETDTAAVDAEPA